MGKFAAIILTILALFLPHVLAAQMQVPGLDSTVTAALDSKLDEYFSALERLPASAKIEECDFMLDNCPDSLIRQYTAVRIYDHYLGSKVMGDEAVAVHMVDDWFVPGKVSMYNEIDLLNAQVYAKFHRNSLVGNTAPVLAMKDIEGNTDLLPRAGRVSILFFYDSSCAKCKLETMKLKPVLEGITAPLDFYAVYSGVQKDQWDEYRETRWNIDAPSVTFHHLWDPELDSDFQVQYGVLQTPQMLLVDEKGIIVGRGLDSDALAELLPSVLPEVYEYGAPDSFSLYETIFEGERPSAARLLETADYIKTQTLAKADSSLCRHMLGDLMYYLMDTPGEEYKLALGPFIDIYVLSDMKMWEDASDVKSVVRPAEIMMELLSRIPVGSRIPKLKVNGVPGALSMDMNDTRKFNLRRLHGSPAYVIFMSPGCSTCDGLVSSVPDILSSEPGAKILLVDPERNSPELLDIFDLSVLPHVISLDKKGRVTGKYISFE